MLSGTVDMTFRSLTVAGAAPDWSYRYDAPVSRFTLCRAPETRCVGEHGGGRGVNWDVGFGFGGVHIRFLGNGHLESALTAGHFGKAPK